MKSKIFLICLVVTLILTGCSKEEKESNKIVETNGMLSYTIDGEKTETKPTKEGGYIVNKIMCTNGSDMMWDNNNWEVELTSIKSNDRCTVDFTKDINTPGYRVTVTSNVPSNLDSLSKATTENGTIIIYSTLPILNVTGCNARIDENKIIVENVTSNQTCNIVLEDKTLANTILAAYPPQTGRTDFSAIDNGTSALYTDTDDQGTTYYFSGSGVNMNNWVSFAGKMWRIIRINGNGSVRLLYAGTGGEDGYIGSGTYSVNSSTYRHPAYVGWKYTVGGSLTADRGNGKNSNSYTIVETWYNGLSTTDKNYIDTEAIYCNDRSIGSGTYSTSSTFFYAAYARLVDNNIPTFKCNDIADRFTTFGLMTADEIVYAGGLWDTNSPKAYYYLNAVGESATGAYWWWTMSPSVWNGTSSYIFFVFGSTDSGHLSYTYVVNSVGVVRPVVSLKAEVVVTGGDGSANSPYEVAI